MLSTPDYLAISKRRAECAACGRSLVESDRHPSVLVEPVEATEAASPATGAAASEAPASDAAAPDAITASALATQAGKPAPLASVAEALAPQAASGAATASADESAVPFRRLDYCEDCWREVKDRAYFSFWIGRRNPTDLPVQKLNRTERNLALVALFDSLAERAGGDTDYSPHLFFLAHLLMRYRIFKYLPSEIHPVTGAATLRFSRTDGEEEARVPDLDMPPEEIVRIKDEVEAYLQQSTGQRIVL